MPTHYAIDANIISGTVNFNSQKTMNINFTDTSGNTILFTKAPRIQLTIKNASTATACKTKDIKTGSLYSGFAIGFQTAVTLEVEWQAVERA